MRGLKHFFLDSINNLGEDVVRSWLASLGYDEHLVNVESRAFTLTFHCISNFKVVAKDAIHTELDNIANTLIAEK